MPVDMNQAKFWSGMEIEGRLYGLSTVFIGNPATLEDLQNQMGNLIKFEHIYFNEEVALKEGVFDFIRRIPKHQIVTLSFYHPSRIAELPKDLLGRCHIVLVIEEPALSLLKRTDTVKIEVGSYHNFQTTKQVFHETLPVDYEVDKEW